MGTERRGVRCAHARQSDSGRVRRRCDRVARGTSRGDPRDEERGSEGEKSILGFDQFFFFFFGELLYCGFSSSRFAECFELLVVDDLNGPFAPRVLSTFSFVVFCFAFLEVDACPRVERIVTAAGEVEEVGHTMVGRVGIEPTANWLRANCSTAELPTQVGKS